MNSLNKFILEIEKDKLLNALQAKNTKLVLEVLDTLHPIDIAILLQNINNDNLHSVLSLFNTESLAAIIEQADEDMQQHILTLYPNEEIISIFHFMSRDDVVDILGNMPINSRKNLVNLMKTGEQKIIQELLGYDEDTAGGLMTTEYLALSDSLNVSEALKKIKQIGPSTEVIETIFVLNSQRRLVGTVDLRQILSSDDEVILADIAEENFISVYPETDQEEVSQLASKYDLKAVPVISRRGALLGIITQDDIIDVIVEEHTEDILHLGGVSGEESLDSTLGQSVKMRLPWLFINLFTAFLASFTVSLFEGTIQQVVALAAAMPIVTGMGGNAGTQTLSIMIRSIALGEISFKENLKPFLKEIVLGIINGAATGALTGVILYTKYGNPYLGIIIFISMILNLVIAGITGFVIPLILKALKADPALSSAIFLTTATDVFGFFIFLGLAQLFLPLLV